MHYWPYQKLIVWQKAMDLAQEVYRLVKLLPADERFDLSSQIRRAVVSIPSNIAEGQGRQTEREFKQFLSIAKGSVFEVETQLLICVKIGYLSQEQIQNALSFCDEIGRILTKLVVNFHFDNQPMASISND